jgi:hypothetical protein
MTINLSTLYVTCSSNYNDEVLTSEILELYVDSFRKKLLVFFRVAVTITVFKMLLIMLMNVRAENDIIDALTPMIFGLLFYWVSKQIYKSIHLFHITLHVLIFLLDVVTIESVDKMPPPLNLITLLMMGKVT